MFSRPRVLLLVPHLCGGGAERVIAHLTRGLSPDKYEVHLGLITRTECKSERMPSWVKIHTLGARRVRYGALPLLRLIRRVHPHLILSSMAHLNFLVLLLRPFFPRITRVAVRQNAEISGEIQSGNAPGYTGYFYRHLYPAADRVVCQTHAMAEDLQQRSRIDASQVAVLANPVDAEAIRTIDQDAKVESSGPGPHLLAVGRLVREKGFDLLIEALASLRIKYPSADLTIVGSGRELDNLRALRSALSLDSFVHLAGYDPHPERFFRAASLFVCSSRQEGLPNALLEAAAGGLPIAALPSSTGIVKLLAGKRGVWLGKEISAHELTAVLLDALSSIHPGQRFPHLWMEPFHMGPAILAYERMIDDMLSEPRLFCPAQ
jgi:glycosyltransferase involved in cell wall biosynthesis